jgi:hypothetical protein
MIIISTSVKPLREVIVMTPYINIIYNIYINLSHKGRFVKLFGTLKIKTPRFPKENAGQAAEIMQSYQTSPYGRTCVPPAEQVGLPLTAGSVS